MLVSRGSICYFTLTAADELLACFSHDTTVAYLWLVQCLWWEVVCNVFTLVLRRYHKELISLLFLFFVIRYLLLLTLKVVSPHTFSLDPSLPVHPV